VSVAALAIASGAILAACGSGSTAPIPVGVTAPVTGPAAVPTLQPASVSTTQPLAANSAQTIAIPSVGGATSSFALPAAAALPTGTVLDLSASTTPSIPGVVSLTSVGRHVLDASTSQITILLYELYGFSNPTNSPVTFPAYPALTFTLPSFYTLSAGDYYLAYFNGSTWQRPITAPGTVNGQTISFAAPPGAPTYLANVTYGFALYYQPFAAPAPAPVNTSTPTPSPTGSPGAIAANPSSFDFGNIGAASAQTLALTQVNGSPTFSVDASNCALPAPTPSPAPTSSPASPAPTSSPTPTSIVSISGTSPNFTVTPNAPGNCTLTVTGAGQTLSIPVIVTSLSLVAQ
jgi:hypothetical protein